MALSEVEFIRIHVFRSLEGATENNFFNESDFEIILQRPQSFGLGALGFEVILNNELFWTEVYENYTEDRADSNWYMKVFLEQFKGEDKPFLYSAIFFVPQELLDKTE